MATIDVCRKFAEQAVKVEQILEEFGVTRKPGHVIFVLGMANTPWGVSQKQVIEETGLPKYAVTKLIGKKSDNGSLVAAGLLSHTRDVDRPKQKTVTITDRGREMVSRVTASLRPSRSPVVQKPKSVALGLFDDEEELAAPASASKSE
jgi:DNA-binding MarR family transcriptional regulator